MRSLLICDYTKPEDYLSLCEDVGAGMEFQDFFRPDATHDIAKHREWAKGLPRVGIHAPFFDLVPGSVDPKIRQVALDRFNTAYENAASIGAMHIVFHHGFIPIGHWEDGWVERCVEFWGKFFSDKGDEIECHLENTLEHDPRLILEVLSGVNHPCFSANLDVGHAHAFSTISLEKWVEQLGDYLRYAHLHSNGGEKDDHLALGAGTLDAKSFLTLLQERAPQCVWAIESRGVEPVRESLAFFRRELPWVVDP